MLHRKKRILVIDDDNMHLYTTKALLENELVEVITHTNGFGVTRLLWDKQPDLVLLDMNMPEIAGEDIALVIRDYCRNCNIPVVFYSSNDEEQLRQSAVHCQAQGYICKGDVAGLRRIIDRALARESARSGFTDLALGC